MRYQHLLSTTLTLLLCCLASVPYSRNDALAESIKGPPISAVYQADKLTDDVHVIHGPVGLPSPENQGFMNNPAIVRSSAGLIIIDAGSTVQTGEMVLKLAAGISDQPVIATISTHIHGDHWLANQAIAQAFPQAKHYAHPAMIAQAKNGAAQVWVDLMHSLTDNASQGTVAQIPDQQVVDGDALVFGNKTFRIIHKGKAHTETDIMIHLLEDDVYFLGDNTFNGRLGRIDDGSFIGLGESLNTAIGADASIYVPGHGLSGDVALVERYHALTDTIYKLAAQYYEEGLADYEMKPKIVAELSAYQNWSDFDDAIGRFISIAVLEAEQHAFD